MNYCLSHQYAGVLPCPWPLCPNGIGTPAFRFERTDAERKLFYEPDGTPVYAWMIAGKTTAHTAAQLARRTILALNGKPTREDDGYLYHFTSEASVRKILESRDFWMTDYRDFPDQGEIRHGVEVARATFKGLAAELHEATRDLLDAIVTAPLPEGVYVTCFCMLRESPYHWQEYAKDGSGAALVIDPAGFDTFLSVDQFTVQFTRVAYTWDDKALLFTAMARHFDAVIRFDIERSTFLRASYLREMMQMFAELLPMCKDVSFLREHEMRIVFSPQQARIAKVSVPAREFNGRRYVTMRDVVNQFRLPVSQLILGPSFAGDPTGFAIPREKIRRATDLRSG